MTINVWIDGSARPNPGRGGIGIVFKGDFYNTISDRTPIYKVTNNQAEYYALIRALEELLSVGNLLQNKLDSEIIIHSDSDMLVYQMSNMKKIDKGGAYVPLFLRAQELAKNFSNLKFEYIPRGQNCEANSLAGKGSRMP